MCLNVHIFKVNNSFEIQGISHQPETKAITITNQMSYLVIENLGVKSVISDQELNQIIRELMA